MHLYGCRRMSLVPFDLVYDFETLDPFWFLNFFICFCFINIQNKYIYFCNKQLFCLQASNLENTTTRPRQISCFWIQYFWLQRLKMNYDVITKISFILRKDVSNVIFTNVFLASSADCPIKRAYVTQPWALSRLTPLNVLHMRYLT